MGKCYVCENPTTKWIKTRRIFHDNIECRDYGSILNSHTCRSQDKFPIKRCHGKFDYFTFYICEKHSDNIPNPDIWGKVILF